MGAFEYITVPVSIVLALGLGRLLSAALPVLAPDRRDWLHVLWCVVLLMLMLAQWLSIWRLHDNDSWSGLEFIVVMASPVFFYTAAHMLVSCQPESVTSWTTHLDKVVRPVLVLLLLNYANFLLREYLIADAVAVRPTNLVILPLTVAALIYPNNRWLLTTSAISWTVPVITLLLNIELE